MVSPEDLPLRARTAALAVAVGGLTVELSSPQDAWLDRMRTRYAGFESARPADLQVRHRPRDSAVTGRIPREVHAERQGSTLHLSGTGFLASLDLERREALLESAAESGPLDVLLRWALPLLADGLVLHGCALACDRGAVLCCGASGAGKSTLAGLLPHRAMCDELAVVRPGSEGFFLESSPFWRARAGTGLLVAIFLLRHGEPPTHRVTNVPSGDVLRRLLEHVAWPDFWPERTELCFDRTASLAARVPVYDLAFLPRPDVWSVIEQVVA